MSRLLVVALVLSSAPVQAQEDPVDAHYEEAHRLEANEQYAEALKELEAAYLIRQPPILLYDLGRLEQKLGHAREALSYYERYLTADYSLAPDKRAELWQRITELRRIVGGPPQQAEWPVLPPNVHLVPVRFVTHHDRGLIGGGLTLLLTGYAAAMITGSVFLGIVGSNSSQRDLYNASGTLLIPVLGPFVAGLVLRQAYWSVPWMLVDGTAQVAGLVMTIIGARRKIRVPVFTERLTVAPFATPGGGGLVASGQF